MTIADVDRRYAPATSPLPASQREPIVNDFAIQVATVNGSGSQTANSAILRALFKMGIPVAGKNIFPSNIQGLPTWYVIRASRQGFTARRENAEIVALMNPVTAAEDLSKVYQDGVCFYDEDIRLDKSSRPDVVYYPMPVKKLIGASDVHGSLKDYIANMVYVGVLAQMIGIEIAEVERALNYHFRNKARAVKTNMDVVNAAVAWAQANLTKTDAYRVERMHATDGYIMIDGNTAGALGAIYGGLTFASWYPITPATSFADALNEYLPQLRYDTETKTANYAVVQAEDELAALGMVIGAGWAGARALTSTSGPGISLMTEFAGMGYFAEIPAVIWDVQRMGPSTGLPTRVSQGDVLKVYFLGHGDTKHVVLLPGSPAECFEFGWRALDLADQLQTPIFVLSDLDLGLNQWMTQPFAYPSEPMKRGKVLTAEDLERMGGFARYKDVDGDGIGWRTLPGTPHPLHAYLARGTGHNERAVYSERPDDWEKNMERLGRKFETARTMVPQPVVDIFEGTEIGLIGFGSSD
ncbi:MAG: 2-oxoacid:acceptor oxidoreductase family protein, partial [Chloroflexi bacterium]|nr:2-oxoacid:acceptor oxidoreductase family protein [Chloroflexota bacterium]